MLDRPNSRALPWRETLRRHRAWLLVGLAILFVLIVRVRLCGLPLERDEGEYAYAGQLILQGVPPYEGAYNMKLPGTYAAYAAIMAVFGQSPSGIRLGLALVNIASIVLVFLLGRKLLDEATGIAAAVAFALLSLSPSVLGLAAHATHFIVLTALAGILVLLRALPPTSPSRESGSWSLKPGPQNPGSSHALASNSQHPVLPPQPSTLNPQLLLAASGLLFGLAFLMKQHGLFFGLFGFLYLLWVRGGEWLAAASQRRAPVRRRARARAESDFTSPAALAALRRGLLDLGWFTLGWLLPYGLTCLVLWWAGAFHQFVFWTITYAAKYASAISLVNGPEMLRSGLHVAVGPNLVLWVLPWVGALVMWWEGRFEMRTRFFLTALLFCSFASSSVGLYFREHYFITVLPVLALLTGVAVSRALHLLRHDKTIELFLAVPILGLFAIGIGAALIGNGSVWLTLPKNEALRSIYGSTLFAQTARAADYLKTHTPKDARVAVLGSEPEIYFLSHRRSATGYIYMYSLMEKQPYAPKMQDQMIAEIEQARPEYVIYVDDDFSWLTRPTSDQKVFEWWKDYWAKHLNLVQMLEVEETHERGTDMDKPPKEAPTLQHILILERSH